MAQQCDLYGGKRQQVAEVDSGSITLGQPTSHLLCSPLVKLSSSPFVFVKGSFLSQRAFSALSLIFFRYSLGHLHSVLAILWPSLQNSFMSFPLVVSLFKPLLQIRALDTNGTLFISCLTL